jgi:hypothetical protein
VVVEDLVVDQVEMHLVDQVVVELEETLAELQELLIRVVEEEDQMPIQMEVQELEVKELLY